MKIMILTSDQEGKVRIKSTLMAKIKSGGSLKLSF